MIKNLFKSVIKPIIFYSDLCDKYPFQSISLSTGIILFSGDLILQKYERVLEINSFRKQIGSKISQEEFIRQKTRVNQKKYEFQKAINAGLYGIAILGPFFSLWYVKWLPKLAPMPIKPSFKQITIKVLWDETICSWFYYISYLYCMTLIEERSHQKAILKLKKDFLKLYTTDLKIWPIIQYLNFAFVPPQMQAFVVSIISIFWSAFMSSIQHK